MKTIIDSILREIREDRTTPAVELVRKGVDAIALFITNFAGSPSLFFDELIRISKLLIDSQPSMAPFFHLANILLLAAEGQPDIEEMKRFSKEATKGFFSIFKLDGTNLKDRQGLIPEGAKVLTHSYSSTVLRTFIGLAGKEKCLRCSVQNPSHLRRVSVGQVERASH
jgi:translation initiation factor 2B subunit (eIF-2B alpha/beta/delta family)